MITLGYFYPLVFAMGCQLKNTKYPLHKKEKKEVNLKSLVERFGPLRNLWEGEKGKNH
jgi:hypothetical protein